MQNKSIDEFLLINAKNNYSRRVTCYLCECPKYQWAIIRDFGEFICRGCLNFEGPDRIHTVLETVRGKKRSYSNRHLTPPAIPNESAKEIPIIKTNSNNSIPVTPAHNNQTSTDISKPIPHSPSATLPPLQKPSVYNKKGIFKPRAHGLSHSNISDAIQLNNGTEPIDCSDSDNNKPETLLLTQ